MRSALVVIGFPLLKFACSSTVSGLTLTPILTMDDFSSDVYRCGSKIKAEDIFHDVKCVLLYLCSLLVNLEKSRVKIK